MTSRIRLARFTCFTFGSALLLSGVFALAPAAQAEKPDASGSEKQTPHAEPSDAAESSEERPAEATAETSTSQTSQASGKAAQSAKPRKAAAMDRDGRDEAVDKSADGESARADAPKRKTAAILRGPKASAQARRPGKGFSGERPDRRMILMRALSELDLSDEQRESIRTLNAEFQAERKQWRDEHREAIDALREKARIARESQDREAWRELREQRRSLWRTAPSPREHLERLKGELTEDQVQTFERKLVEGRGQMMSPERREKMKQRMQGRHGAMNAADRGDRAGQRGREGSADPESSTKARSQAAQRRGASEPKDENQLDL